MANIKPRKKNTSITIERDIDRLLKTQSQEVGLSVSAYISLMAKFVDKNGIERLVASI